MIRHLPNLFSSYSFSFSVKTGDNIRYYKKTTHGHNVNSKCDEFILHFMENATPDSIQLTPKRGRPLKKIKGDKLYTPCNFSLKKTTIKKIQEYKMLPNMPSLDAALERHLCVEIPVRK